MFRKLGFDPQVEAAGFTPKFGATFFSACGQHVRRIDFAHAEGLPCPEAFQVPRDRFDQLLLEHAEAKGARVFQGWRVLEIEFGREGVQVRAQGPGEESRILRARFLIDASGRSGLVSRTLGLRKRDPKLQKVALFGHFRKVKSGWGEKPGDIRIVTRSDSGWLWFIPLPDDCTSVGLVIDRDRIPAGFPGQDEAAFRQWIGQSKIVAEMMASAERMTPLRVEADFSYRPERYAGERWLLAGDAGSFLDPVFSSGVHLALASGMDAAEVLLQHRGTGALPRRALREFERLQIQRYRLFRRFVLGFDRPEFRDLFFHQPVPEGIYRAVVSILAGQDRPSPSLRWRLQLFFTLVALQRRFTLVPRLHHPAG